MSLRIPGALPPATPMIRRDEPARRPLASSGKSPGVEAAADQWVRGPEASPAPEAPSTLTFAPAGSGANGVVTTGPDAASEAARLAAERVRQDVMARPSQASGIHGNLVAGTVLNLLA